MRGEKRLMFSTQLTEVVAHTFHLGLGFEFKALIGIPLVVDGEMTARTEMFWETRAEHWETIQKEEAVGSRPFNLCATWTELLIIPPEADGMATKC
jgi:hypothetical protein